MTDKLPYIVLGPATHVMESWERHIRWARGIRGEGLVKVDRTPTGPRVRIDGPGTRFVKLTGTTSPYGGTEVYPSASGTWTALPGVPALSSVYEDNGVSGLTNKVVKVWPGFGPAAGLWRFTWVRQKAGGSSGFNLPGCPCLTIPATINLRVATPPINPAFNNTVFPATLTYGAKPSDLAAYGIGDPGFFSASVFTSTNGQLKFRYNFICIQGFYAVRGVVVPSSPTGYQSTFGIYQWLAGIAGNTCSPFSLTNGSTANNTYRTMGITMDG